MKKFTLIELLIVVSVIAILISILFPAIKRAKTKALEISCSSQLRQLGTSFALYASDYEGWLPLDTDDAGVRWINNLDDYLGLNVVYTQEKTCGIFKCPAWFWMRYDVYKRPGISYCINYHVTAKAGILYQKKLSKISTPAERVLLGDSTCIATSASRNNAFNGSGSYRFLPRHSKRVNILFCDMHVDQKETVMADDLGSW